MNKCPMDKWTNECSNDSIIQCIKNIEHSLNVEHSFIDTLTTERSF